MEAVQKIPGQRYRSQEGQPLTLEQTLQLEALTRRYQRLWWPLLAHNLLAAILMVAAVSEGATADDFSLLWFFDGLLTGNFVPTPREIGGIGSILIVAIRISFLWLFSSFLRIAKPWPYFDRQSMWLAVPLALFAPFPVVVATAFRMRALARRLRLPGGFTGGFFGLDLGHLHGLQRQLRASAGTQWQISGTAQGSDTSAASVATSAVAELERADRFPRANPTRERTWLDRVDEYCARIGIPTRWHHFHPEALAYGVLCGMSPEDFLKRGYNKRVADLPEGSRALGKALADQLESRIRTEFGLKRAD